jgi:hypothetical protein
LRGSQIAFGELLWHMRSPLPTASASGNICLKKQNARPKRKQKAT